MTAPMTTSPQPRRLGRSLGAIFLGFLAVVILSLVTDELLHLLKVYPPWGQSMYDSGLCLLALSYRIVYSMAGGYITARYAPSAPIAHAVVLGVVGLAVGTAGAVATMPMHLGPAWFSIAIAATALPCSWLGECSIVERVRGNEGVNRSARMRGLRPCGALRDRAGFSYLRYGCVPDARISLLWS